MFTRSSGLLAHVTMLPGPYGSGTFGRDAEDFIELLADCGFTSPAAIIKKCAKQLRLGWAYPLVALAGRLFGRIDIRAKGALDAVKETRLPILLMHGEEDDFVPCSMSRELFEACRSEKELYTFPISRHLHSYLLHEEEYGEKLKAFLEKYVDLTSETK